MSLDTKATASETAKSGVRWTHIFWIVLATVLLTIAATYWVVSTYIYARDFKPVALDQKEAKVLNDKLQQLGISQQKTSVGDNTAKPGEFDAQGRLIPEKYSEAGASREVYFSERELNGLLANNTDLARKLAIDLSDDLVSAKLLVPVDPEFPLLGGKTLRLTGGLEMAYRNAKPVIILKGVSIMGVPVPGDWLGGLKNIDLVNEFGSTEGFWRSFADGIEYINVEDGKLKIKLKP